MSTLEIYVDPAQLPEQPVSFPLEIVDDQFHRLDHAPKFVTLFGNPVIDVLPGNYLIRIQLPGKGVLSRQVTVGENDKRAVMFQLTQNGPTGRKRLQFVHRSIPWSGDPTSLEIEDYRSSKNLWENMFVVYLDPAQNSIVRLPLTKLGWHAAPLPGVFDFELKRGSAISYFLGTYSTNQFYLGKKAISPEKTTEPIWKLFLIPPFRDGYAQFASIKQSPPKRAHSDVDDLANFRINFGGTDAQIAIMLDFLTQGNFGAVNQLSDLLVDTAEDYMRGKFNNPMNAVVGGYLLIKTGRLDKLHNWTINLKEGFPTIPDGAIIHAWFLLLSDGDRFNEVLDALLQAVDRGVPYLSTGVRLLYDGLSIFKNHKTIDSDQKSKIEAAIAKISLWINCVDWSAPYTVLLTNDNFDVFNENFRRNSGIDDG